MKVRLGLSQCALAGFLLFGLQAALWADGAYHVSITKTEGDPAVVTVDPVGSQAQESESASNSPEASGSYAGYRPYPDSMVGDGSLFNVLVQIFAVVSDFGLYGGYGYWQAPLPTRFQTQSETRWDARPGMQTVNLGLCLNLPVFQHLEFEPYVGMQFGDTYRSMSLPAGTVKEKLTLNETHYGLTLVAPLMRPFFLELGIGGTATTTTTELETDLPAFAYDGFVLDHAATTQLTYGGGISAPLDWRVRLRGGVQGYREFADFGNSWGVRAYITYMFTNKRFEYESF